MDATAYKPQNIRQAGEFVDSQTNRLARLYASRVYHYYLGYGTPLATKGFEQPAGLNSTTANRIHNMLRHLMVGDCTPNGRAI